MAFIPKTPLNPEYFNLVLPGITSKSKRSVETLLKNNHDSHHVFFNDKKFHNHLTHHLLAAYSFGANDKRLEEIYEGHASYQRPLPPTLDKPLTRENYHGELGKAAAYTSFLRLFEKEIEEHGILDTVRRWVYSGDMLSRTIGGVYHPLIHIGYGVEFGLGGQVAEGLAMAACTENRFSPWISDLPALRETIPTIPAISTAPLQQCEKGDKNVLLDVIQALGKDSFFDSVVSAQDDNRLGKIYSQPRTLEKINDYSNQWKNAKAWTTRQDLNARVKELFTTAVVCHGATGFSETNQAGGGRIDFFLMHALTSSYFIHILVPHLLPEEAASLIQGHLFSTLVHYVVVGRPDVKTDRLLEYVSPNFKNIKDENPHSHWAQLLDATVYEEEHVIKAIRACAQAQILYNDDPNWFDDALYLKAAQLTYDLHGNWTFGVGFD